MNKQKENKPAVLSIMFEAVVFIITIIALVGAIIILSPTGGLQ